MMKVSLTSSTMTSPRRVMGRPESLRKSVAGTTPKRMTKEELKYLQVEFCHFNLEVSNCLEYVLVGVAMHTCSRIILDCVFRYMYKTSSL